MTILTPKYLKDNYLLGIEVTNDDGTPYADDWYQGFITRAVRIIENSCNLRVTPTTITDETHDYYAADYMQFAFVKLFSAPVISVQEVRIIFPTAVEGVIFPPEWVKLDKNAGQIQLVPTAGTLSQVIMGQGGSYLPMIYHGGLSYLPQLFHITYTAGFESGNVPVPVIDAICKMATIEILSVAADLIYPPGMTSKSIGIDGVSESFSIINNGQKAPVFTGRISQYQMDLYGPDGRSGLLQEIKTSYHGLNLSGM